MSIDTTNIKAGDWVQIAHGDWFEVTKQCGIDGEVAVQTNVRHTWIWPNLITAHRASEPAPELKRGAMIDNECQQIIEDAYREPEPEPKRGAMSDAEWEHLLKTAQRGRAMEIAELKREIARSIHHWLHAEFDGDDPHNIWGYLLPFGIGVELLGRGDQMGRKATKEAVAKHWNCES